MKDISKYAELVVVKRRPIFETKLIRSQHKAMHILKKLHINPKKYGCHHIIPVSVGGTNDPDNIVIMERDQHQILHDNYIDPQLQGLEEGQTRVILLPKNYDLHSVDFQLYDKLLADRVTKYFMSKFQEVQRER